MVKKIIVGSFLGILAGFALLVAREARYGTGKVEIIETEDSEMIEAAFVANALEGTVSVIDLNTQEVVGHIDVLVDGRRPSLARNFTQFFLQPIVEERAGQNFAQDTDLSPDGRTLYVSRGFLGDVAAFDIATGNILWRTNIRGIRSDHMTISPSGDRLYVAALILGGDVVEVLDARTGKKLGRIKTGRWPHDVHVKGNGERIYVASLGNMLDPVEERGAEPDAYTVTLARADDLEVVKRFDFEAGIRPFEVTDDETILFAQLSNTHALIRYDVETEAITHRIDLPVAEGVTEDDWDFEAPHHGLALSPDESRLCIAGRASDYAAVVSADDLSTQTIVPVGDAPSWSAITEDGQRCLVANTRSNDVSIVDIVGNDGEIVRLKTGEGAKHITIGSVPKSVLDVLAARR